MVGDFEAATGETRTAKSPAADHLFQVREEAHQLEEKESLLFHNMMAKASYLCKRSRPDIQPTVSFLTTQVKAPDQDDWKKLVRMIGYLKGTKTLVLTLSDNGKGLKWWIDASNGVHPDLKGYTGATLNLGKGSAFSKATKQKINTTNSTESELVGTFECLVEVLSTNYFLQAQGYNWEDKVIFQDNKSALLLQKNVQTSSASILLVVFIFCLVDSLNTLPFPCSILLEYDHICWDALQKQHQSTICILHFYCSALALAQQWP